MDIKVYDIEIYPNLLSIGAKNIVTGEKETYAIHEKRNDLEAILEFIDKKHALIGYNLKKFDNLLLYHISLNRKRFLTEKPLMVVRELKDIANEIIRYQNKKIEITDRIKALYRHKSFRYLDLLAIINTVNRTSLKQISVNLKWWNVQTLPYPHDKWLTDEEIEVVLDYMFNDCDITEQLYIAKKKDVDLRKDIKNRWDVDVTNVNDTGIAKMILNKYYSEATGIAVKDFENLRSYNKAFSLKSIVFPVFNFKTKPFQELMVWLNSQIYKEGTKIKLREEYDEDNEEKEQGYVVSSKGLNLQIALGGLHSIDLPGLFDNKDGFIYRDADVASLYPTIMVNNNIRPRHVLPEFITILAKLIVERLADKAAGRTTESDTKKLIINSIFGLLGSEYYWLRDTKALLRVTINGQLYLCRLIEDLQLAGIEVVSANTDGIVCKFKGNQEEEYKRICAAWEEEFRFTLEYKDYEIYARKDVNNYISLDANSSLPWAKRVKTKGKYFNTEIQLNKGYWFPVIPKALNEYFLKGIDPEVTIKADKDIYNFMCSIKADKDTFEMLFVYLDNSGDYGKMVKEPQQENNRWIVVNKGGKLIKYERDEVKQLRLAALRENNKKITPAAKRNRVLHVDKDNYVQITNKVLETNADKYDINYDFYIKQAWEVIRQIKPLYTQQNLFQ